MSPPAPPPLGSPHQEAVAERLFAGMRRAWLTYGLVASILAMHLLVGSRPYRRGRWGLVHVLVWPRGEWLLARYGSMRTRAVDRGELWRLVSAGFLHVDALHLTINTVGLVLVGRVCESVFGPVRTLALFLVSVLGGTSASWLLGQTESSVGASGGIFGLMGAVAWFGWTRAPLLPPDVGQVLKRRLTIIVVLNLLLGLPIGIVDNWAHAGGLVAGVIAAVPLGDRVTDDHPQRGAVTGILATISLLLLAWAALGVITRA